MLSDLKLLSGSEGREMLSPGKTSAKVKSKSERHRSTSPASSSERLSKRLSGEGIKSKSSLFTVDSLLAGGPNHKDSNDGHNSNFVVHEFNDLSPPATPPSPAVLKPLAMPNSPIFGPYPFPYPANLLIPGLPFPHPAAIHSWPGIKFSPSNHHLNDGPHSKSHSLPTQSITMYIVCWSISENISDINLLAWF